MEVIDKGEKRETGGVQDEGEKREVGNLQGKSCARQLNTPNKGVDQAGNTDTPNTSNHNQISLLSLNVCGLANKFKYDVFAETLSENKIVCIVRN